MNYMYVDKKGFNSYLFSQTSDLQDVKGASPGVQRACYSLFTFYMEQLGRMRVQDYVIKHTGK